MRISYFRDKTIYFSCVYPKIFICVPEPVLKRYSRKTFLKWNAQIVNKLLKEVKKVLIQEISYNALIEINDLLGTILNIYHEKRYLYSETIVALKQFFEKYGYFCFYKVWEPSIDFFARKKISLNNDFCKIRKVDKDVMLDVWYRPLQISYFLPCDYDTASIGVGFLPNLLFSKNKDLVEKFVLEIYNPARKAYLKEYDLMKKFKMEYLQEQNASSADLSDLTDLAHIIFSKKDSTESDTIEDRGKAKKDISQEPCLISINNFLKRNELFDMVK